MYTYTFIHRETHEYVRSLVTTASETLEGVDLSMLVVDAVKRLDEHALNALEKVLTTSAQVSSPIMLVMNKYDLVGTKQEEKSLTHKVHDLTEMITDIYKNNYNNEEASVGIDPLQYTGENTLYVSALKGKGMKKLRATLKSLALERSWSYHSSLISDRSDLELVTEIIREKLFRRFNKELPYAFEQENM
jgi:GTP-binding protein Era